MTRVMLNRRMLVVRQRARQEARIREDQAPAERVAEAEGEREPHAPEPRGSGPHNEGQ